jgi:hypothetical protein
VARAVGELHKRELKPRSWKSCAPYAIRALGSGNCSGFSEESGSQGSENWEFFFVIACAGGWLGSADLDCRAEAINAAARSSSAAGDGYWRVSGAGIEADRATHRASSRDDAARRMLRSGTGRRPHGAPDEAPRVAAPCAFGQRGRGRADAGHPSRPRLDRARRRRGERDTGMLHP